MAPVPCPFPGCVYNADNADAGITAALLNAHAMSHSNSNATKRPDRPEIGPDMSETEWSEVKFNFESYKKDVNIVGKPDKIRSELLQCCAKSVKSRLFQNKGEDLKTISEDDLLTAIKDATVNKITRSKHRSNFFGCMQSQGETPQALVSRLKSMASTCDFYVTTKCSDDCRKDTDVRTSYVNEVVQSQLVNGLYNPDHKNRLLVEGDKLSDLHDKVQFLDMLHTTDMSMEGKDTVRNDGRKQSEYKKNKSLRKCECGKSIESRNEKHEKCRDCFESLKTKECSCGTKILPNRKLCFECSRKKSSDTKNQQQTLKT